MIEQKNGEKVFEYKFPEFISDNNEIASKSDDYEVLQVLGSGNFSCVLKVKSKINKQIYAMKKVDMDKIEHQMEYDRKYYENEIRFLEKLRSPYVCKCYAVFKEGNYLFFIMEFMNNGDLNTFYNANKALQMKVPEEKLWDIFYKSISGLKYIHEQGLIHRDIKLENLFLDDDFNIKIGDFNVSATIDEKSAANFTEQEEDLEFMTNGLTCLGTEGYMAPEVKRNKNYIYKYGPKVDVFSMGVSYFELCYGCKPYEKGKKADYFNKKIYSNELNKIVDKMTDKDDRKRISSDDAYFYIRKYFINKYVKNSSVDAVLHCFYCFPNFKDFFNNNKNKNLIRQNNNNEDNEDNEDDTINHKEEIGNNIFNVIQSLSTNNKDQIDDNLYELRNSMTNAGLNARDNEEIDPGMFISFFLTILNSVLNEITEIDEASLANDLYVLSTSYKFDKYVEEMNFNLYINTYSKRLLSLISRNFFNIMEIKQECKNPGCNYVGYSFSMLNFIPLNVNILESQCQKKDNLHLRDAFNCLINNNITLSKDRGIKCNKCNDFTIHQESKKFYHTSKDLIIIFDRGEDFSNKTFINFDDQLILNKAEVERYNEVRYNLVSILVKMETQKEREEYICFMPFGDGNWVSNKNKKNSVSLDEVKKSGIIVALFYYSEDNNLILQPNNWNNGNGYSSIW